MFETAENNYTHFVSIWIFPSVILYMQDNVAMVSTIHFEPVSNAVKHRS